MRTPPDIIVEAIINQRQDFGYSNPALQLSFYALFGPKETEMKPFLENITMPDSRFPVKVLVNSASERAMMVHPHWHAEVEILYYLDGTALQQVNDSIFTAVPGDIVVIGKDQLHSTYSAGIGECRIMVLQFSAEALMPRPADGKQALAGASFSNETVYHNPIKASSREGSLLLGEIEEIFGELTRRDAAYDLFARASLCRLAGLLERCGSYTLQTKGAHAVTLVHSMLEKTFKLVEDSFSEDIPLGQAAAASNLSTTHFCRLFRRATGMTFHEYLTFYRINRAERMLHPSNKISHIAFECGFGSVTSFIRNFKKYKNCAPSRYLQDGGQD